MHSCSKEWRNQRNKNKAVAADSWRGAVVKINRHSSGHFSLFRTHLNSLNLLGCLVFLSTGLDSVRMPLMLLKPWPSKVMLWSSANCQAVSLTCHQSNYLNWRYLFSDSLGFQILSFQFDWFFSFISLRNLSRLLKLNLAFPIANSVGFSTIGSQINLLRLAPRVKRTVM